MRKIALTLSFARKTAAAAGATRDGGGSGTSGEKASGGVAGTGGLSDHSDDIDDAKSLTSGGLSGVKVGGGLGGTDDGLYHSADHYENMGNGTAPITGLPILLDLDGDGIEIARLSASTQFYDFDGDGLDNRAAWAGAGDAVLFHDLGEGRGDREEMEFNRAPSHGSFDRLQQSIGRLS